MIAIRTSKNRLSRRSVLAGLGASGMLLPLLDVEPTHAGPRNDDGYPKRLIVLVSPNGVIPDAWFPTGSGPNYTLSESTLPLEPYKQDVTFLRGVNIQSFNDDGAAGTLIGGYNAHSSGPALLTGAALQAAGEKNAPTVPSLDQVVAAAIAEQVALPFRTLTLSGWYANYGAETFISYPEPLVPAVPEGSPYKLFEMLFASGALDAGELQRLRDRRASILDFVGRDLERFGTRLGTDDRIKIEAHLSAIRAIEQQNDAGYNQACTPPTAEPGADPARWQDAPALFKLHMDLMTAAIACDQTRVITFHMDTQGDGGSWPWLGGEFQEAGDTYPERSQHDVTHHENDSPEHRARKVRVERWYMEQFAALVERLQMPEGTGRVLDHSAVLYLNQMGSGSGHHTYSNPCAIAGSCGGYLKTGQNLSYAQGIPHNGVLAALANAMGVPTESFGDPKYGGELTDIKA